MPDIKIALFGSMFFVFCAHAAAQNIVADPDFDAGGIGAWIASDPATVVVHDAAKSKVGTPGSGSISVTNNTGNGIVSLAKMCIDGALSPGTYDLGGWILLPTAQAGSGSAGVAVSFYSGANCSGMSLGFINALTPAASDNWVLQTAALVAPAGVLSALVSLRVDTSPNSSAPFEAWFDGIRLGPTPTMPVELQTFEVD
jgi:hypothetical protein